MVTASVLLDVSNPEEELPKSTEVIDDGITALVSVEPEEELQLCITKAPAGEQGQLKEERVFAQIGERGKQQEHQRWVLNTGETNHMTGAKSAFFELDSGIRGMVTFGDGYGITAPVSVEPEEEFQLCITKAPAGEPGQLKEERVFAQIGKRGE